MGKKIKRLKRANDEISEQDLQYLEHLVWNEKKVMEILNVDLELLHDLRYYRALPHITIRRGNRIYLKRSVYKWLEKNEVTLGLAGMKAREEELN